MRIVKVNADAPEASCIAEAVEVLRRGEIVAYLTDTLYALGADARNSQALARIYAIKGRAHQKALPVIVGDRRQLEGWVKEIPALATRLMDEFWPGPLTLVMHAGDRASDELTAGSGKIAVRIPANTLARQLSQTLGAPIVSTSANLSGMPEAVTVAEIEKSFAGRIAMILDSGKPAILQASTIIDVTVQPPRLLRAGAIPKETLEFQIGEIQL